MKNIKLIITVLAVALFAVSCDTHDDYDTERPTIVTFASLVGGPNAIVPVGGTLVKEINVFVSNVSNAERTFNVLLVAEETEVASENYSFSSTVTIPANENTAIFSVTLTDVSLISDAQPLTLEFDGSNPDVNITGDSSITINVRAN